MAGSASVMSYVEGHFGEWMQGLIGSDRKLALVTKVCPATGVRARIKSSAVPRLVQNLPVLDQERCSRFLTTIGVSPDVLIELEVGLPPGGGAGMSTAALVAIARACAARDVDVAAACLSIEGATDPLMLDRPDAVLWAPRDARVLAPISPPPAAEIVGGFWGPPSTTDPLDLAFPQIDDLVDAWQEGPDLDEAAHLASDSYARTTAMRGPADDPTSEIARGLGALGVSRAHTGPARSMIFAPGTVPPDAEAELRDAGYSHVTCFPTGGRQ